MSNNLALPPREAFAIGARTTVSDAAEMDAKEFNRGGPWPPCLGVSPARTLGVLRPSLSLKRNGPPGRTRAGLPRAAVFPAVYSFTTFAFATASPAIARRW